MAVGGVQGYALLFPARGWKPRSVIMDAYDDLELRFTLPRKGMETCCLKLVHARPFLLRFTLPRKGMETGQVQSLLRIDLVQLRFTLPRKGMETR